MAKSRSIAEASLELTGLFEVEVLLELLLRFWQHPFAEDLEFRGDLLESATEVLHASVGGAVFINEITPQNMSFIAAAWFAELSALQRDTGEPIKAREERLAWLDRLKQSLPSCFCDPENLVG